MWIESPVGVDPPPNPKRTWQKKLRGDYFDVRNRWLAFDPQLYHCVEEVTSGTRRSLALLTPKNWRRIPAHFLEELVDTGFYPPYLAQNAEASADALLAKAKADALPVAGSSNSLSLLWLRLTWPLAFATTWLLALTTTWPIGP